MPTFSLAARFAPCTYRYGGLSERAHNILISNGSSMCLPNNSALFPLEHIGMHLVHGIRNFQLCHVVESAGNLWLKIVVLRHSVQRSIISCGSLAANKNSVHLMQPLSFKTRAQFDFIAAGMRYKWAICSSNYWQSLNGGQTVRMCIDSRSPHSTQQRFRCNIRYLCGVNRKGV